MSDLRTAAQQALEALGSSLYPQARQVAAMAALRAALAEPDVPETDFGNMAATVAEPVSAGFKLVPLEPTPEMAKAGCYRYCAAFVKDYKAMIAAAPAAPPQREPLTDDEIHDCFQQRHKDKATERRMITRAIEQLLKGQA